MRFSLIAAALTAAIALSSAASALPAGEDDDDPMGNTGTNGIAINTLSQNGLIPSGLSHSAQAPMAYQPQPIAVFAVRLADGTLLATAPAAPR